MGTMIMSSPEMEGESTLETHMFERSKVFGFPSKLWLGPTDPGQILAMTLANRSEHDMDVVLTLYDEEGSVANQTPSSSDGYIPNLTLNEVNRIPAGYARKVSIRAQGNLPVSSGKITYTIPEEMEVPQKFEPGLVVKGKVANWTKEGVHRFSANIDVNNGQPF